MKKLLSLVINGKYYPNNLLGWDCCIKSITKLSPEEDCVKSATRLLYCSCNSFSELLSLLHAAFVCTPSSSDHSSVFTFLKHMFCSVKRYNLVKGDRDRTSLRRDKWRWRENGGSGDLPDGSLIFSKNTWMSKLDQRTRIEKCGTRSRKTGARIDGWQESERFRRRRLGNKLESNAKNKNLKFRCNAELTYMQLF